MTRRTTKLEICCQDLSSVRTALTAGAHRIELCTALDCGGLTPSYGLITAAVACAAQFRRPCHVDNRRAEHKCGDGQDEQQQKKTPAVMVLVRPRAGGFVYSRDEMQVMCADIRAARAAGAQGVVFGCLKFAPAGLGDDGGAGGTQLARDIAGKSGYGTNQGASRRLIVDKDAVQTLLGVVREAKWSVGASSGIEDRLGAEGDGQVTFHRAFDDVDDRLRALNDIISINSVSGGLIKRILTSGSYATAAEGVQALRQLCESVERTTADISIMPGAGITKENVTRIVQKTGCLEVHASAKRVYVNAQDESRLFYVERTAVTDDVAVSGILAALAGIDGETQMPPKVD